MDRATLIAALVGALIATIPILISNIVQIILHVSEIRHKEREAKRQAREKWLERDILTVMGLIERLAKLDLQNIKLDLHRSSLEEKMKAGSLDADKLRPELDLRREEAEGIYIQAQEIIERMNTLTLSFDDVEINNKCTDFVNARIQYMQNKSENKGETKDWVTLGQKAGYLHKVLRNKLISIRDT
jgi:hypothetical protein